MAMVLDAFISRFSDFLFQLVEEKMMMLLGVDEEIQNLRSTLETISRVLEDAERRRIHDKAVDGWLKKLRDVMYDADDILDTCRIEAEKYSSKSKPSKSSGSKVSICNTFHRLSCLPTCFRNPLFAHDIGKRIRDLNLRLEKISKEKDTYGFLNLKNNLHDEYKVREISDSTSSLVESDLVGNKIREDTRKLVELLTRHDMREHVLVFAIVGMGGIGKTTLAQLVFNEDKIRGHFPLKFWVSVTKSFDENDILRDVIISAGGGEVSGVVSRNQLETKLVETLRGKKFFLVLDDVWDESVWEKLLRNPLCRAAAGSRVLVTSRTEWVARQMKAVYCHQVKELSPEDGWSLLCKKLILSGREGAMEHLKDIGMSIVRKCGGLPLAINAMAAMLCTKSRRDWEYVLKSSLWSEVGLPEQVNKPLLLSYLDLPSHLKQCFTYFSLLPKGYILFRDEIIQLWIAEGFIKDVQGELSISMEETGELYCRELHWRNLLQSERKTLGLAYKMHDLLRSLAEFLAQDESLCIDAHGGLNSKNNYSKKLRRLSMEKGEVELDVLRSKESLRTLILFRNQSKLLDGMLHQLPFLRVLNLKGSKVEKLPDSLTSLMHLRYLDLSQTHISALPENIGNLKNLQFLILDHCKELNRLPNNIVALKNLRALKITLTGVKVMPAGIGRLRNLRSLIGFALYSLEEVEGEATAVAGKWSTLEELGPLLHLRWLSILHLERASNCSEASAARLKEKPNLINLYLCCTPGWIDEATEADIKRTEEVFEVLQPPSSVETLGIVGFPGSMFPNWTMTTALSNITHLFLLKCKYCMNLPPIGHLSNLVYLRIVDFPLIKNIGSDFMGASNCGDGGLGKENRSSTFIAFPKLQQLIFGNMPSWEKWHWDWESQAMPCLESLELLYCSKLISLPSGLQHHATSLTELKIKDAHSLISIGKFVSLQELNITFCFSLERVFDLPALKKIFLIECPSLNTVKNLNSIQFITLGDFYMNTLPEWLREAEESAKPEKLTINCNRQLFDKICQKGEEEWSKIQHINYVEIICKGGQAQALYNKDTSSVTLTYFASTSVTAVH